MVVIKLKIINQCDVYFAGPAIKSGMVQEGDILYEVDGIVVLRSPFSLVSTHLLGPKDSRATVVFLRGDQKVTANFIRQPVSNLMSVQRA